MAATYTVLNASGEKLGTIEYRDGAAYPSLPGAEPAPSMKDAVRAFFPKRLPGPLVLSGYFAVVGVKVQHVRDLIKRYEETSCPS